MTAALGAARSTPEGCRAIEIGLLVRQCLDRRIPDHETLRNEVAAWEAQRNAAGVRVQWMCGITQAREKRGLVYFLGTLATIAGIVTLSWEPMGVSGAIKIALLFATGAAVVRGLNHTVGRFGLGIMPNPLSRRLLAGVALVVAGVVAISVARAL